MNPRKVDQRVSFLIAIPDPALLIVRPVRDLVIIPANRRDETKLVLRRAVVYQRSEATEAVAAVVNDGGRGSLQAKIAAVSIQANVISKAFRMAPKSKMIIRRVKAPIRGDELRFIVSLETAARHHIEH